MNWKLGEAKFKGQCWKCGRPYAIGDPIAFRKEGESWARVHSGCLTMSEMQQRELPTMPLERTETPLPSIVEPRGISTPASVEESLELAVIALTEISKTLRAIEEKMRK
jgi:hypothetical protein